MRATWGNSYENSKPGSSPSPKKTQPEAYDLLLPTMVVERAPGSALAAGGIAFHTDWFGPLI
jgi:hypothetical protein